MINKTKRFVVDSTSQHLKFATFQQMYFSDSFDSAYGITTKDELKNRPIPMEADPTAIAKHLGLKRK
jgi:hypothetical protein